MLATTFTCTPRTSILATVAGIARNDAGADTGRAPTISIVTSTSTLVPRAGSSHEPSSMPVIAGTLVGCIALVASILTCVIVHKRRQRHRRIERLAFTSRLGGLQRGLRRNNTNVAVTFDSTEDDAIDSSHDKLEQGLRSQNSYDLNHQTSQRSAELSAPITSTAPTLTSSPRRSTSHKRHGQQSKRRHSDNIPHSKSSQRRKKIPHRHPPSHSTAQQSSFSSSHSQTPLLPDPQSQVFGPVVGSGLHEADDAIPDDAGGNGDILAQRNRSRSGSNADVLPRIIVTGDADAADNNVVGKSARSQPETGMLAGESGGRAEGAVDQDREGQDQRGHESQGREETRRTERDLSIPTRLSERPSTSSSGASTVPVSSSRTDSGSGSPPPPSQLYSSHSNTNTNSSPDPSLLTPSPTLVIPPSPTFSNSSSSIYHYDQERKEVLKRIESDVSLGPNTQLFHASPNPRVNSLQPPWHPNNLPGTLSPPIPSYSESDLRQMYPSPALSNPEYRIRDRVYPRGRSNVASRLEEEPPPAYEDHRATARKIEQRNSQGTS